MEKCDFGGWATRNNLKCSDGRVIMKDAFKENDGKSVPLVWNHQHNDPDNVLGHAMLKNREDGVYAYCTFNDSPKAKTAKLLVEHGDISGLSICANDLKQNGSLVSHGKIREVSLVLAGANPGAYIDNIMSHGEEVPDEAIITTGCSLQLSHADGDESSEETVGDVFDTLSEKQKKAVYALLGEALDNKTDEEDEGGSEEMKHNVFDNSEEMKHDVITHSQMMEVIGDAKRYGSMKESALQHGITDVEYLFPEAQNIAATPAFISRKMGWVSKVMGSVGHSPFSRVKSTFADITEDDARAKGYIKGKYKKEEVFSLLKRTTGPTTVYKKQKMDRDDVADITGFDVIAWLKGEMRTMLDEELARAYLVGDGRLASSDDHIKTDCIRPVAFDDDLFTIKVTVDAGSNPDADAKAKAIIKAAIKARKDYRGSGEPTFYTTEDVLTDMLLLEDSVGRPLYTDEAQLARKLRVREIVTMPVMENMKGSNGGEFIGVIVNLTDYRVGADKGGSVNMFDDFDIDYNAQKYLIETRCSGALVVPYSAMALEMKTA